MYEKKYAFTTRFNIYSRFSDLVYSTSEITDLRCNGGSNGWDGKHQSTGEDLPMGTYIFEIYYQDLEGWKHKEQGYIQIIR